MFEWQHYTDVRKNRHPMVSQWGHHGVEIQKMPLRHDKSNPRIDHGSLITAGTCLYGTPEAVLKQNVKQYSAEWKAR